jgi:hypothetical protein
MTAVLVVLGALASAANARNLSISDQTVRATFRELEFSGGAGTTRCAVTMEGSFHARTVEKTLERLVGYLTRVTLGACATGTATVLAETLPWHVQYNGFTGTLPAITTVRAKIVGMAFRIREPGFGVACLARTTAAEPSHIAFNREAGGVYTSGVTGGTIRTGAECFNIAGTFAGTTTSLTVLNSSNRIEVRLI